MLDLTYRPSKFSEFLGNKTVVKLLLSRSRTDTLVSRSMMFGGPKGAGKTSFSRVVAKAILCSNKQNGEPCLACDSCISVLENSSDNYEEFDAAAHGTVDKVKGIVDSLEYGTFNGKPKVIVLDEAQRLTKASQDVLLRPMEDRRLVVIICTTEPHSIKESIRSRVEEYSIYYPGIEEIRERMIYVCNKENIEYENDAIDAIIKMNKSCPRTCLSSLESVSLIGPITNANVSEIFKYDDYSKIVDVLSSFFSNAEKCIEDLDNLLSRRGPGWVRESISHAVVDGFKSNIKLQTTYPVSLVKISQFCRDLLPLVNSMSLVEKINQYDILSIFMDHMSKSGYVPKQYINTEPEPIYKAIDKPKIVESAPTPSILADTKKDSPLPKRAPPPPSDPVSKTNRSIEIDGIKFSSTEDLTSLDSHSMNRPKLKEVDIFNTKEKKNVELDKDRNPIPEKEFFSGFIKRFKTGGNPG